MSVDQRIRKQMFSMTHHITPIPIDSIVCLCVVMMSNTEAMMTTAQISIFEELPLSSLITNVKQHLPGHLSAVTSQLRFRLVHGEHTDYFQVGPISGDVITIARIDRESLCPTNQEELTHSEDSCQLIFKINVLRIAYSGVEMLGLIKIVVVIKDIDDNACEFHPASEQDVQAVEEASNLRFALYRPQDLDTGPRANGIDYHSIVLMAYDETETELIDLLFELVISNTTSNIIPFSLILYVKRPLNFETRQFYRLSVVVHGVSSKQTCRLIINLHVIDINDHRPIFNESSVHIAVLENATSRLPIYTAIAHDADKDISSSTLIFDFSIFTPPLIRLTFRLVPENGSIFLRVPLNYSQQNMFKFSLTVQNPNKDQLTANLAHGNNQITMDLMDVSIKVIDINDNPPIIVVHASNGSAVLTLSENQLNDKLSDLAVISVHDNDAGANGKVTCKLDGKMSPPFYLTQVEHFKSEHRLLGQNKRAQIEPIESKELLYKLSTKQMFDREETDKFHVLIICSDYGEPALTSNLTVPIIILDINDNAPEFSEKRWNLIINEDSDTMRQMSDFYVTQVRATDKDTEENAVVDYHLQNDQNITNLFTVDKKTGVIRTRGNLDREMTNSLQLTVVATDRGVPALSSSVIIHVTVADFNDETPQFENKFYKFDMVENVPHHSLVGTIVACDKDVGINAALSFSILPMSNSEPTDTMAYKWETIPFRIDANADQSRPGCFQVHIKTKSVVDREDVINLMKPSNTTASTNESVAFKFEILAEDSGYPVQTSRTKVLVNIIDINDESPEFIQRSSVNHLRLIKMDQLGVEIIQLYATDRDQGLNGTVRYFIKESQIHRGRVGEIPQTNNCDILRGASARVLTKAPHITEFIMINEKTGSLKLLEPPNSSLTNRLIVLTVEARDLAVQPLSSHVYVCLVFTDASQPAGWRERPLNTVQDKPSSSWVFHVFLASITGILVFIILTMFLAYRIWHRGRANKNSHRIIRPVKSAEYYDLGCGQIGSMITNGRKPSKEGILMFYWTKREEVVSQIDAPEDISTMAKAYPAVDRQHFSTVEYDFNFQSTRTGPENQFVVAAEPFTMSTVPHNNSLYCSPLTGYPSEQVNFNIMSNTYALQKLTSVDDQVSYHHQ